MSKANLEPKAELLASLASSLSTQLKQKKGDIDPALYTAKANLFVQTVGMMPDAPVDAKVYEELRDMRSAINRLQTAAGVD
jgi:DNA polymerase III delta prime subunit